MRYIEQSASEVLDTQTGMIWQKAIKENLTHKQALEHAMLEERETGHPWRVPSIEELQTLLYPESTFPDMPPLLFWSSSPYVGIASYAWFVGFDLGDVLNLNLNRYDSVAVRLVRSG